MIHAMRRSFKSRIFVTVLLTALLPLVVSIVLMVPTLIRRSERQLTERSATQLADARQAMHTRFEDMRTACETLAVSDAVLGALDGRGNGERALYAELFADVAPLHEYARFGLYDARGRCLYGVNSPDTPELDTDWGILRKAARQQGLVFGLGDDGALLAACAVAGANGTPRGYLVYRMDEVSFDALLSGCYDPASNLLLLDPQWRMIYHSQPLQGEATVAMLRQELLDGKPLTASSDAFSFFTDHTDGFTLILQTPQTFTASVMRSFYFVEIVTGAVCLLLCFWGAWMLSRLLSQPVQQLSHAMGEVERGDFDVRLQTDRQDELGRLSNSFNHMVEEYQGYLARSVQKQKELNEAQMRMMQAQLNPHFLYNTLDSVKWMAVEHNAPQIADLATDLAGLLRVAISESEFITLEQELELIERYIDVQSLRFGDSFTCEIAVAEAFQSCMVPKLVLQPLVENAIVHGVCDREDGYVKLWAEETDGDLSVFVSDNGVGMPPELVEQLNHGERRIEGGHLGLNNVNSILRLHYGEQYGITAYSQKGQGSRVCVRLPLQRKEPCDVSRTDR